MKFKMLVLLLASTLTIVAMEEYEEKAPLEHLPTEIHAQILLNVLEGDTAKDAIKNILNFTKINKTFAPFLNDELINKLLIQKLAEKYYNNNQLKAAQELNTGGARLWIASYLAESKQQKQAAIAPLFAALNAKDNKAVINLINAGMDANTRDKKLAKTPLMVAAHNGDLVLMDFLVAKGAAIDSSDKQGLTPLMYAIRNGKINAVQFLLDKGALIDAKNNDGFTPLMWAIHRKQPEIAKLLLHKNADISLTDNQGVTALMESATHNLPEIAQLLISKGVDVNVVSKDGFSALIDAAFEKSPAMVSLLLKAGANPSQVSQQGITALFAAAQDPETIRILLNTPARNLIDNPTNLGFTALMSAASAGNLESTKLLLQAGANQDIQDNIQYTALSYALSHSLETSIPIIKLLLAAHANPNVNYGADSIVLSIIRKLYDTKEAGDVEQAAQIIKDLLAHKANPNYQNLQDGGSTPILLAAWTPLPTNGIIEALIDAGADINQPNIMGITPLIAAIPNNNPNTPTGHMENLRALLAHADRINFNDQDNGGYTALTMAIAHNNFDAVRALLEAGANPTFATQIGTPFDLAIGKDNIQNLLLEYYPTVSPSQIHLKPTE